MTDTLFTFQSVEVLAIALNAVNGISPFPNQQMWKQSKLQLASALVARSSRTRSKLLQELALRTLVAKELGRHKLPADEDVGAAMGSLPTDRVAALRSKASDLAQVALGWADELRNQPGWNMMCGVLSRIVAAGPQTPVSIQRDGAAGEQWVLDQLSPHVPAGWQLDPGVELDFSNHPNCPPGSSFIKGVKGELDAVLLDPDAVCRGVLEVKLGNDFPYNTVFNDVKKLTRAMNFISHGDLECTSMQRGRSVLRVAPDATPVYLIVRSAGSEATDGKEVVRRAEKSLLKISLSMSLCSQRGWRSAQIVDAGPDNTRLQLKPNLIDSMRKKVDREFVTTLRSVPIYELQAPTGMEF